jgi:HEAT repeat protein
MKSVMRLVSVVSVGISLIVLSGCSTVAEEDLADLQSPNDVVKRQAIERVGKGLTFPLKLVEFLMSRANEEKAAGVMIALLRSGKESKETQLSLINALGRLGKEAEPPVVALIEELKDPDHDIRDKAVEALGKTKNRKASAPLVKLLNEETDKNPIIWALGEIGDPKAIPALNPLLDSEDKYVRFNARKALAKIGTGQVEGSSQTKIEGTLERKGPLEYLKMAFDKYQDAMSAIFHKIAGTKNRA